MNQELTTGLLIKFDKSDAALEYEKRANQVKKRFKEVFW